MAYQDPRNLEVFQAQRMESVYAAPRVGTTTVFWRTLERVGKMQGGTSASDAVIDGTTNARWFEFFFRTTATSGTNRGFYMQLDTTGVGAANTMQLWSCLKTAGAVTRGGSALHAIGYLAKDVSCTGTIGELMGINAHLIMEDEVRNVQGSYYALKVSHEIKAGNVLPTVVAMTNYYDVGPVWTPFFWNLSFTVGVGRAVETYSTNAGAAVFCLRVRCPDASVGYIHVYNAHI